MMIVDYDHASGLDMKWYYDPVTGETGQVLNQENHYTRLIGHKEMMSWRFYDLIEELPGD